MKDWRTVLELEFNAEDGSFLDQLRNQLKWDKESFMRLIIAMRDCCLATASLQSLERWLANGFWYIPEFVRSWATHENFPRPYPSDYYERAYQILDHLAYWFFFGESPYQVDFDLSLPE